MKKVLLLIGAALVLAAGCQEKEPVVKDSLEITSEESQTVATAGGTVNFTFTTAGKWTAAAVNAADTWASINPTSGEAGENTVAVSITPNTNFDAREFKFTIASGKLSKELKVVQGQLDGFTIAKKEFSVPAQGGEVTVEFETNAEYKIDISEAWVTQNAPAATKALEAGSAVFTVEANSTFDNRIATITFTCGTITETVTINQEPDEPYFEIVTEGVGQFGDPIVYLPQEGGSMVIEVDTNLDFDASTDGQKEWLTVNVEGNTITISAAANEGCVSLEDWVYVACTRDGNPYDDYGAMIHVQQNGIPVLSPSYIWHSDFANLGIAANGNNRLAYSGGYLLASDGTKVVSIDPATGTKVMDVPLPNGVTPYSFTTDDAGNVLVAVSEPVSGGTLMVYTAASLNETPAPLITWVDDVYSGTAPAGNLRVRGDIKKDAVVTLFVPVSQYAVVWEITNGVVGAAQTLGVTPKASNACWAYQNGVVAPIGSTLAEGLYMGCYSVPYDLEYYNGTEWNAAVTEIANSNYSFTNLHTMEYKGDRYMAHLSTGHWAWAPNTLKLYKLIDPANPLIFFDAAIGKAENAASVDCAGGDVLLHPEEDMLVLFVISSSTNTISRLNLE